MEPPHPVEAVKAAPGRIGSAVKGHKPVVYVGVIALALVLAYYIRKREQNASLGAGPDPGNATVSDPSQTPDYGTPYAGGTFGPTQGAATGAYYGYNDPTLGGTVPGGLSMSDLTDLIYALNPGGYYTGQATPTPADPGVNTPATLSPTGGGPPARSVATHAAPAKANLVAKIPQGGTSAPIHDHGTPPDPRFPFLSSRGWFAVVTNPPGHKPGRYHKYANGLLEYVG